MNLEKREAWNTRSIYLNKEAIAQKVRGLTPFTRKIFWPFLISENFENFHIELASQPILSYQWGGQLNMTKKWKMLKMA